MLSEPRFRNRWASGQIQYGKSYAYVIRRRSQLIAADRGNNGGGLNKNESARQNGGGSGQLSHSLFVHPSLFKYGFFLLPPERSNSLIGLGWDNHLVPKEKWLCIWHISL